MPQSFLNQMETINHLLAKMAEKETTTTTYHYEDDDDDDRDSFFSRPSLLSGIGACLSPVMPVIGVTMLLTNMLSHGLNSSSDRPVTSYTKNHRVPGFEIPESKISETVMELKKIAFPWKDSLDSGNRLSSYMALFNGCALYMVPQEECLSIIDSCASSKETDLLHELCQFVYEQMNQGSDSPSIIRDKLGKFDGPSCPDVVSLYLFIEAVSRYFPNETDHAALNDAKCIFQRLPEEYRAFALGKYARPSANPAMHQFLLPQLESSSAELNNSFGGATDYISRQCYLHLRIAVYYKDSNRMSLSEKLQAMFESEKFAYQAADSNFTTQSILRDFAHTYKNMKTTRLPEIAKELFQASQEHEDPKLRQIAHEILMEAKIKQELTSGIQLMHFRCLHEINEISKRLMDSIVRPDSSLNTSEIEQIADIVDFSLQLCFNRILYDGGDRGAEIARIHLYKVFPDFAKLRKSFEQQVIVDGQPVANWLIELGSPVTLSINIDPSWSSLCFRKESFASVLLTDLIAELLFNALKYADLSKPITLSFLKEGDYLLILSEDQSAADTGSYVTGNGLISRNETLSLLNHTKDSVTSRTDETGKFHVTLKLRASLLLVP